MYFFFFSSRRRHTRLQGDWSSDVCSSDLIATTKLLMKAGAKHIVGCDRAGAIYRGRTENMNSMKEWFAQHTNPKRLRGTAGDALVDADVFIGLSGPGVVGLKDIKAMRRDPIVFAMANPIPEI